jgi:hypothetical protein
MHWIKAKAVQLAKGDSAASLMEYIALLAILSVILTQVTDLIGSGMTSKAGGIKSWLSGFGSQ